MYFDPNASIVWRFHSYSNNSCTCHILTLLQAPCPEIYVLDVLCLQEQQEDTSRPPLQKGMDVPPGSFKHSLVYNQPPSLMLDPHSDNGGFAPHSHPNAYCESMIMFCIVKYNWLYIQ